VTHEANKKSLKSVEQILSKQVQTRSDKEAAIDSLQVKYSTLSHKYEEMKTKTEAAIASSVTSKTVQYEVLSRDLSAQVVKLLYENTKLRKFIEEEFSIVVPAPDYSLLKKENLGRADASLFESIEDLVKQNGELKSKTFTFATSSHAPVKSDGNEQEMNNLMKRLASTEQEVDRLKTARDNWRSQANTLLEENGAMHRQLRNIQYEYDLLERRAATSEASVNKLKHELANVSSVVGPSEAFLER
jgi:phage shock protein A